MTYDAPPTARPATLPERIDGHEAHLKQLEAENSALRDRLSRVESMLGLDLPMSGGPAYR